MKYGDPGYRNNIKQRYKVTKGTINGKSEGNIQ